jgi:hypothetical protein
LSFLVAFAASIWANTGERICFSSDLLPPVAESATALPPVLLGVSPMTYGRAEDVRVFPVVVSEFEPQAHQHAQAQFVGLGPHVCNRTDGERVKACGCVVHSAILGCAGREMVPTSQGEGARGRGRDRAHVEQANNSDALDFVPTALPKKRAPRRRGAKEFRPYPNIIP